MSGNGFDRAAAQQVLDTLVAQWIRDMGLSFESVSPERVVMRLPYSDHLCRTGGLICGQALMAAADTAMIFVAAAALGRYREMATTNVSMSFLRPLVGKDVIVEGRALKTGRSLLFGEIVLRADGDERPAAHATCTYAMPPESGQ